MTKADKEGRRKAPILRFKGFTDDWEQRELGQLMEIGSVKRIHMNEWKNTGVPFFRARDIVAKFNNKKISDPIYISEETYNSNILKSGKVKKGQLLITGVGTIGIPYLITDDSPLYFKDGNVIWLKNNNYDGNFIFYFFTTNLFKNYLFKITGTGTVGTYTIENAKKTPISTPQINEQIKIGKLFNILENLLALYDRKLKLLSQMKKYFLDNLFTEKEYPNLRLKGFTDAWEQRKLNDIAKVYDGIHETPNYTTYGIPFASVENIRTLATKKYVSKNFYEEKFKIKPQYNDILMTRIGDIGTSNVVSKVPLAYYVSLALIRLNADQNAHFFKYYFDSEYAQKELWSRTLHIAFPKKINKNEIGKINVYTTSIKEENKISQLFNKLNYLLTLYENKQQHLNEIKKTLLNTMFI